MFSLIKRWHKGESKMQEFKNDFHSKIIAVLGLYVTVIALN